MPIPLLIPLISGGMKAVGGMAKRKKAGEERKRITRWSPWTGIKPPEREKGSAINDLLQGGAAGMKLAKGIQGMKPKDPGMANLTGIRSNDPTAGISAGGKFTPAKTLWSSLLGGR